MNRYSNNLRWQCAICDKMREDEFISVRRFDVSGQWAMNPGAAIENVKYCNDDSDCTAQSLSVSKGVLI